METSSPIEPNVVTENKFSPTIAYINLINTAKILLSDGGENKEYDRAIIEFINYLTNDTIESILNQCNANETLRKTFE